MSNLRVGYSAKFFKHIPSDWGLIELKKLVKPDRKITYGIVQPGQYDPNGILLIRGQDYMTGWAERGSFFKVSPALHQKFKRSTTRSGDVLISIAGYTGTVAVVPSWIQEANLTQTTARICCKPDLMDGLYLSYFLQSDDGKLQSKRYTKGSAQEGLNLEDVEKFLISVPPLPEQQKIATILSSVDDVIGKTRAQIDKLKDLKTGMMQELLTKGIGHTEFKDSPVGRIPAEWTVKKLDDLSEKISDGIHTTPKYVEKSEYHFINGNNLQDGQIVIGDKTKCVPESEFIKLKRDLTDNTILMSINGTIGNLAFYAGEQVVLGKSAAFISLAKEQSKKFIFYVLQSQATTQFYDFELTGSTIKNLSLRTIKQTPVPIPTKKEQALIVSILSENDKNIRLKTELLNQIEALKKALMQDLLTGKVRVNLTDKESAAV